MKLLIILSLLFALCWCLHYPIETPESPPSETTCLEEQVLNQEKETLDVADNRKS